MAFDRAFGGVDRTGLVARIGDCQLASPQYTTSHPWVLMIADPMYFSKQIAAVPRVGKPEVAHLAGVGYSTFGGVARVGLAVEKSQPTCRASPMVEKPAANSTITARTIERVQRKGHDGDAVFVPSLAARRHDHPSQCTTPSVNAITTIPVATPARFTVNWDRLR